VSELYDLSYNTQQGTLKNRKAIAAELNPRVGNRNGHPTVLSPENKKKDCLGKFRFVKKEG
jgi:hypothetical protein